MSEFPSLSGHIAGHTYSFGFETNCSCEHPGIWTWDDYRAHLADAWRSACTITTVEQLQDLPNGSIVRSANGHAVERTKETWMINRPWFEAGNSSPESSERIPLPALLIWHPDWERP